MLLLPHVAMFFVITVLMPGFKNITRALYAELVSIKIMLTIMLKMLMLFEKNCQNGHLKIAKWLHSLGANIHVNNDEALRSSFARKHLKVAQWLLETP